MKIKQDIKIVTSTQDELSILNRLGEEYKQFSEMNENDRAFLNSLLLKKQPKKILEVGVSKGGSSLVILNAIKDKSDAHLYSCDYLENCYCIPDKKVGFYVDNFPELKKKWTLYSGGLTLNFLDEIGADIDFCLIDTVHSNPGEILDFLMVLPYLSKQATVVFHDTNLHLLANDTVSITNALLMSAIVGQKLIPANKLYTYCGFSDYINNIGAIEINEDTYKNIYNIFNLLALPWAYMPSDMDILQFLNFIKKFYDEYYVKYFEEIIKFHKVITIRNKKELQEKRKRH